MIFLIQKMMAVLVGLSVFTTSVHAVEPSLSEDAATIPEPSVALIGGLCGIIFLFWRRK